jgi:subtilase family serine protease
MSLKDIFPSTPSVLASVLLALFVSGSAPQSASAAEPRIAVRNSAAATPALRGARLLGRLAPARTLSVGLTLPLRNQSKLDTLLHRMYTRGDALYGKFLTPAEFDAQFAPSVEDYSAVASFARSQGLSVTGTQVGRTLLTVSGPVSTVETAFGVRLGQYQTRDGRTVYANASAPRLPRKRSERRPGT